MAFFVRTASSPCFLLVLLSVVSFCMLCVGQNGACFNGERVGGRCQCNRRWTGINCEHCDGRVRVESRNGTIVDHFGGGNYTANRACLFFIEAGWPASSIRLRFNHLSAECQWDYLYVFDGDSIFAPKLAAFTGNILKVNTVEDSYPVPPTPIPVRRNNTNNTSTNATSEGSSEFDSSQGSGSGHLSLPLVPYQDPTEVTIASSGPRLLLYFYTDMGLQDLGFNLSYWVNYLCPDNCSGQGDCDETSGSCICLPGWTGEACREPACPNNCFENGICNDTSQQCSCQEGYTGVDCSISLEKPHWEEVDYTIFSGDIEPSLLARTSHSAVIWGEYMVVYGGYRFPLGDGRVDVGSGAGSGAGSGEQDRVEQAEVLLYHFATHTWEVLEAQNGTMRPETRYGHSAVVYNDTLYVFGGAKTPQEEITNELWSFDLRNFVWKCLFATNTASNDTTIGNSSNATTSLVQGDGSTSISMATGRAGRSAGGNYLPMPVRSHTAHIVGSKMMVLFGYSNREDVFISYVQEYDIDTGIWSAPGQLGLQPAGRMGHTSVYNPESGLVYVYGGQRWRTGSRRQVDLTDELLVYDPLTHWWSQLAPSQSPHYLHSAVLFGSLMLTYGGCNHSPSDNILGDCFSSDLHIYNSVCNEWQKATYPGLPGNAGRYGHSALLDPTNNSTLVFGGFQGTLLSDLLRFNIGNCSVYATQEECLNGSVLCAWSPGEELCMLAGQQNDLVYQCTVDSCLSHRTWSECDSAVGCSWNTSFCRCTATDPDTSATPPTDAFQCLENETSCHYSSCESCLVHGCLWGRTGTGGSASCLHPLEFNASIHETVDCTSNSCFTRSSCSECTPGCLWCPSLHQCIPGSSYPYTYIYGQCLGWAQLQNQCPVECANLQTCSSCQQNINCGWCNDPSNTGLGACMEGGFLDARNETQCPGEQWHFDNCPACQCNGHSTCVNGSICEHCQGNTTGLYCEQCVNTYYGNPANGGTCTPCDCNGYNPTCNNQNGSCECHDSGVVGDRCDSCSNANQYSGDASNFCHYNLQVGFIYTFGQGTVNPRAVESQPFRTFYSCTPLDDRALNFRFEISSNPRNHAIIVQFFIGRRSQNLWLLANLTEPITVTNRNSFDRNFGSFQGSNNVSLSNLFSFAQPSIRSTPNFTELLNTAVENDYTNHMWDRDVTLVIYIFNLTDTVQYKITVDQTDLMFLLYFFGTFITCFTVLLMAFIIGWYVKRKLELRALIRAQYIELQRRVSRPFAKVKLVIDQKVDVNAPQHPSYAGVETCRDNKAAILTLFVRQPGEGRRGRPPPGRTGLSFGSTLVKVNPSKLKSKDRTQERKRNRGRNHTSPMNST